MNRKVKFTCKILSKGFIATCKTQPCPDLQRPNLFKVTEVYIESCAFYQLGECPRTDCVFATGDNFGYFAHADENSMDKKDI